uniref:Uncharacterized protein n=1 Tax=Pithovirus LCPAC403 TaxID=2506596 RepID=A0A481ZFH3_9VIRU|nr:MAG: hypothetical protein LCPAC403_03650 [Pithovirus LCPAC403]
MTFDSKTSVDTINILFELLDSLPDEWKVAKNFIYGNGTDECSYPCDFFSDFLEGGELFCVEAKSEEQGRILLNIQMAILDGYECKNEEMETAEDGLRWSLNRHYSNQTMEELKKCMNKDPFYEINMGNQGQKMLINIKAYEVPNRVEKFYTGNSVDYLKSYEIELDLDRENAVWYDMKSIKQHLSELRESV